MSETRVYRGRVLCLIPSPYRNDYTHVEFIHEGGRFGLMLPKEEAKAFGGNAALNTFYTIKIEEEKEDGRKD